MRTLRSNKLSLVQPLLVAGLVIFQGMVSRTFAGKEGESGKEDKEKPFDITFPAGCKITVYGGNWVTRIRINDKIVWGYGRDDRSSTITLKPDEKVDTISFEYDKRMHHAITLGFKGTLKSEGGFWGNDINFRADEWKNYKKNTKFISEFTAHSVKVPDTGVVTLYPEHDADVRRDGKEEYPAIRALEVKP